MRRQKESIFGGRDEVLLGLALMIGLLLPHSGVMSQIVNPLMCVLFFMLKRGGFDRTGVMPLVAVGISMLLNMVGAATGKSMLTALSIIMCIAAFPMVNNVRLKNIYFYICFGVIFLSQIAYLFHIGPITSIVDTVWPVTSWGEDFIARTNTSVDISNFREFRLGGLYRNPNHLAKYVSFLLAIYLVNNSHKSIKDQALFSVLCFISLLLTGSRTGFVIGSLLILFGLLRNQGSSKTLRIVAAFSVVAYLAYTFIEGVGGRGMHIEEGLQDSAGAKLLLVIDYLSQEINPIYLAFGHLDFSLFNPSFDVNYSFDCEYGYLIYCFGFFGLFAFIYYLVKIYERVDKSDRIFFFVLLWMLTSSIFMAYRAVFVFMLLLSTIYKKEKLGKKQYIKHVYV